MNRRAQSTFATLRRSNVERDPRGRTVNIRETEERISQPTAAGRRRFRSRDTVQHPPGEAYVGPALALGVRIDLRHSAFTISPFRVIARSRGSRRSPCTLYPWSRCGFCARSAPTVREICSTWNNALMPLRGTVRSSPCTATRGSDSALRGSVAEPAPSLLRASLEGSLRPFVPPSLRVYVAWWLPATPRYPAPPIPPVRSASRNGRPA